MSISKTTPPLESSQGGGVCFFKFFRQFRSDGHTNFFGKGLGYFWCLDTILWQLVCSELKNLGGQKIFEQKITFFGQNGHPLMSSKKNWSVGFKKVPPKWMWASHMFKMYFDNVFMMFRITLICFTDGKKIFLFTKNSFVKATFEVFLQFSAEIDTLF